MTRFCRCASFVALCLALISSAARLSSAATILGPAVPLSDLIVPDESILVGDKLFEDFTYNITGDMPPANAVNVIPIQDDFGNFGIRFQGGFVDVAGDGASDANITYNVTATDMDFLISDAHVVANTGLEGSGVASVTETFLTAFQDVILLVQDTPGSTTLVDEVIFDVPVRTLSVQKGILMFASGLGSTATMSFVDQTFSQIPDPNQGEIPEPATMGLVSMLGLFFGAIYMRRRLG